MAERIIATNDAYAKVGDKYLNNIALDMMWDLNGEKAGWESKEDIPNRDIPSTSPYFDKVSIEHCK